MISVHVDADRHSLFLIVQQFHLGVTFETESRQEDTWMRLLKPPPIDFLIFSLDFLISFVVYGGLIKFIRIP